MCPPRVLRALSPGRWAGREGRYLLLLPLLTAICYINICYLLSAICYLLSARSAICYLQPLCSVLVVSFEF
jgi:hypothetical protein